jgi:threonylcarbamoyladenosine tRNA methylthiotransferase MtaB
MNVYFDTIGCRLNEAEVGTWARDFRRFGHIVVDEPERAELMVFNSCSVTADAAKRSRQVMRRLHRTNPAAKLVLTGCYSDLEPTAVKALMGVDAVIPNIQKDSFAATVSSLLDIPTMPEMAIETEGLHVFRDRRTRAFVKVQDGCRNQCTFCVVTVARGSERSRSIADVVAEVNHLYEVGFQEVVLTGVHIGGYGSDHGTSLGQLIAAVLSDTQIPRIRMGSLEPWDLVEDFFELWSNPRLCPHLHLPLQSGSNSVLKRMARRCSVEEYRSVLNMARAAAPAMNITTDLIVGFPGETNDEFAETEENVAAMAFGDMHIFAYSRREGTPAARMPGHLSRAVKHARSQRIHKLGWKMQSDACRPYLGTARPILWEKPRPGTGSDTEIYRGYTDNYLRVQMEVPAGLGLANTIADARLASLADGGCLIGVSC